METTECIRVLVVDDLPDVLKTLSGLLSDEGCLVRSASNVQDALALLENDNFHVGVLDVRLEESNEDNRDGLVIMHEIKKRAYSMAVIILTGHADVKMVKEALQPDHEGLTPALYFLEKDEIENLPRYVQQAYNHVLNQLNAIIKEGEKEDVEFKSSVRWDYERKTINKDLQIVIAKSIAGMLNYRGGKLLIGVADNGDILGIEKDLSGLRKSDTDGFRLLVTDLVKNYLGLECMENTHVRFETVEDKTVGIITIIPSNKPVFVSFGSKSEFWVRTGNSTRQLDVKEATSYIQSHWGKI